MKLALLIIGLLLLLPGLCGAFFMTVSVPEIWKFISTGHGDPFTDLVVILSGFGLMVGCLGLYAIAKSEGFSMVTSLVLLYAGFATSLSTISVIILFYYGAGQLREISDWLLLIAATAIAIAVVPLPIYVHWKKIR